MSTAARLKRLEGAAKTESPKPRRSVFDSLSDAFIDNRVAELEERKSQRTNQGAKGIVGNSPHRTLQTRQ